jgi:hypothetical protein
MDNGMTLSDHSLVHAVNQRCSPARLTQQAAPAGLGEPPFVAEPDRSSPIRHGPMAPSPSTLLEREEVTPFRMSPTRLLGWRTVSQPTGQTTGGPTFHALDFFLLPERTEWAKKPAVMGRRAERESGRRRPREERRRRPQGQGPGVYARAPQTPLARPPPINRSILLSIKAGDLCQKKKNTVAWCAGGVSSGLLAGGSPAPCPYASSSGGARTPRPSSRKAKTSKLT